MSRKKNNIVDDAIDFLYSLSFLLAIWVYLKTKNLYLTIISFIVCIVIMIIGIMYYKKWRQKRIVSSGIDTIDNMSGEEFEELLLEHFRNLGYKGHLTPVTEDYGADLVLEKDGRKIVVQAKRWRGTVGIEAVQQIIGAIKYYNADKGMVITNSVFTENAYELADSNGIELWDRKKLIELMRKSNGGEIARNINERNGSAQVMNEVSATSNQKCPWCGRDLVLRNGKHGKFWGCSGFPKCKYTKNY